MENKFLYGKRILITRSYYQAKELSDLIKNYGGVPIELPSIKIIPPSDWKDLDSALHNIKDYDYLIFTSVNGVKHFFLRFKKMGGKIIDLKDLKVIAIGPKTAEAITSRGLTVSLMPQEYKAEGIIALFSKGEIEGKKLLLPRSKIARKILPEKIKEYGGSIDVVEAYQTVASFESRKEIVSLLENKEIDIIVFTSSSTVKNFAKILEPYGKFDLLEDLTIACIGPITAGTVREYGLKVEIIPEKYTIKALVKALVEYYQS
ncbi:MAG: uroporphyrinogen-III synthase [Thermodesulfobacteriota bacterium]|nr:uroporphyrinogen-III synthase [Thermodesulfobacteriota bacterium]